MIEYITSGQSHGKGMTITIKGLPSNLTMDEDFVNSELARRQQGYGRGGRMKIETDKADVISGVWNGRTMGSPLTIVVWNKDFENWKKAAPPVVVRPRPGHADLIGAFKYGQQEDVRFVLERSSARETAARVAGGAVAKLLLKEFGIGITSHVINWGGIPVDTAGMSLAEIREKSLASDLSCAADAATAEKIYKMIDKAKEEGDTIGGTVEVIISPVPPFLGSYQTYERKLDARLAHAVLSVQAMKGIEFGMGFEYAGTHGRLAHDEIFFDEQEGKFYRTTNHAGGIEGGMSNGQPIVFRVAKKPIPTVMNPLHTINLKTMKPDLGSKERSDVTALAAAGVVLENAVAFVIADALLERYGGDDINDIRKAFETDEDLKKFRW